MRWTSIFLSLGLLGCGVARVGPSVPGGTAGPDGIGSVGPNSGGGAQEQFEDIESGGGGMALAGGAARGGGSATGGGGGSTAASCPPGLVQTWRYVADDAINATGAVRSLDGRVIEGPGGAPMKASCEVNPGCPSGQVAIVTESDPAENSEEGGETEPSEGPLCQPPPPTCASGLFPTYVPPHDDLNFEGDVRGPQRPGFWKCTTACEIIVVYAGLYADRLVCAPPPMLTCPSTSMPLFEVETERWICHPGDCGGGKYDPAMYQGQAICVPC